MTLEKRFEDCQANDRREHDGYQARLDNHALRLRDLERFVDRLRGGWIVAALLFGFGGAVLGAVLTAVLKPVLSLLIGGAP